MKIILVIIYMFFTTSGMIMMKLGGNSIFLNLKKGIDFKIGGLTLLGFSLYAVSFLLWQRLLLTFDLSYIVPITTGILQIIILLVAMIIFKEDINIYNVLGIFLIIAGVILISLKK